MSSSQFTERELEVLRLLSEQVAVPVDQIVRFFGAAAQETQEVLDRLQGMRCVVSRLFLVGDVPWYWLSYRGVDLVDTGYPFKSPDVRSLRHRRAVMEVRLRFRDADPEGVWRCEREVYRIYRGFYPDAEHIPDALFDVDGERHAIEVELSRKQLRLACEILDEHSSRFNGIFYFCNRRTWSRLYPLQEAGRWPLRVFHLPEVN